MSEDKISVGVLMIGSLYWDCRLHRKCWRETRLNLGRMKKVRVPIRYGRRSSSRGCSYTMVFSEELADDEAKMGEAIFVPFKQSRHTSAGLIAEAENLWTAESSSNKVDGRISADWGSIGLQFNPNPLVPMPKKIREDWHYRILREPEHEGWESAEKEKPAVDKYGILATPWPTCVDGSPLEVGALLATATDPTLVDQKYPSPKEIADAWNTKQGRKHLCYFLNNRREGITTFQDEEIEKCLRQALRQHPVTLEELSSICTKGQ